MIDFKNGDMAIAKDGASGLVVDGSIFWADGQAREDTEVDFLIRYTQTGAEIVNTQTPVNFPVLEIGSKGLAVVLVQTALKCKGYYKDKIDGDFWEETYKAVKRFRDDNYLTGDTVVDEQCYQYLFKE